MKQSDFISSKILNEKTLNEKLQQWKSSGKKIVFTNGCFDILHLGHIHLLSKAASFGDVLIIGLNSDSSVKGLKGNERPLQNEQSRTAVLASLFYVDAVVIFEESTPRKLIEQVTPDVLVKGGDYKTSEIVGADWVTKHGGRVEVVDLVQGYSTTSIAQKIAGSR